LAGRLSFRRRLNPAIKIAKFAIKFAKVAR
jgi:hypothetical protein